MGKNTTIEIPNMYINMILPNKIDMGVNVIYNIGDGFQEITIGKTQCMAILENLIASIDNINDNYDWKLKIPVHIDTTTIVLEFIGEDIIELMDLSYDIVHDTMVKKFHLE